MKIFSAIEYPQVKINLNSKKGNSRRSQQFRRRYKPKGRSTAVHFPRLTHQPGSSPNKYRVSRSQTVKKTRYFGLQNLCFHADSATRIALDARVSQKPGFLRKDALQAADKVKNLLVERSRNPVSLILVHHINSGCIGMIKPQSTQRIQRKGRER